ncbi:DNA polymerase delta subunit 3-like [Schistocerca cancellata]|uniref:DNA polymerase delta subunit 3-like n=1 Tax=Schistocerca cancellata TaxID=274614 RepID=UPI0021192EAC|nr:DNA polymerase delta subunit 3-like [Schistocerca cancellata]
MLDEETENLYIQNIEEFVLDENKVVTYKWLSKTLGVHVNTAKQLLYAFATQSAEAKTAGIKKTFLISGVLLNDGGCKVAVVQEENLQKLKDQFKTITSEHIYSVQKVKNDTALCDLYKVDSFQKDDSSPVPAISCSKCLPRTDSELSKLRIKAEAATVTCDSKQWPTGPTKKAPSSKSPTKNTENSNKRVTNGEADTAEKTVEGNSAVVKNGPKPGSIAAMFAARGSKVQKSSESSKAPAKSTAKGKSGGIATFFNKNVGETNANNEKLLKNQTKEAAPDGEKPKSEENGHCPSPKGNDSPPEKKRKSVPEISEQEATSSKRRKISEDKIDSEEVNIKSKKVVETKSNKSKKPNKRKEKGNDNSEKSVKKRKRIIVADSDSDDDIFEKEEIPESPPPLEEHEPELPSQRSDMEDIIPCTPQQELNKGRKLIRKLVDKTFMDEDGYMITKKEFVYESCSESDHEEGKENEVKTENESTPKNTKKETQNNVKESPKKKVSPPQKSKQATLMNFFKKS